MWNDNDKIIEIFDTSEDGKTVFPCVCPVCNSHSAHVYFHKHNDRHCGIWTWCSNCGASSHMSGNTPKWWKNPDFIDPTQLCAEPDYLEQLKDRIDEWVNMIAPKDPVKVRKPFVMENRFDVILRNEFYGMPAGTSGVIVIKDDFKTMTIDFIDSNGKKINMHETPEDLEKNVEIIKP